jgi:hypothetical protein
MGFSDIARAADQWKWVAISILDHTLPSLNKAVRNVNGILHSNPSSVQNTLQSTDKATQNIAEFVLPSAAVALSTFNQCVTILTMVVTLLSLASVISSYWHRRSHLLEKANRHYVHMTYGRDAEGVARTCASIVKRVGSAMDLVGRGQFVLVGINDGVAARMWEQRTADTMLDELLVSDAFAFSNIKDAMGAIGEDEKSGSSIVSNKLLVILLISSRDPTLFGPRLHESFVVPSVIADRFLIVGIGMSEPGGILAHSLSRASMTHDGTPLGLLNVPEGVTFHDDGEASRTTWRWGLASTQFPKIQSWFLRRIRILTYGKKVE